MKKMDHDLPCVECGSRCCRYVALEVDKPTCKQDYDNIRWYLLHKNVSVFIDHEDDWYVEFKTPCLELGEHGYCDVYDERPRLCRHHGETDTVCEYVSDESPYQRLFRSGAEFEAYLEARGVKWRWKKP